MLRRPRRRMIAPVRTARIMPRVAIPTATQPFRYTTEQLITMRDRAIAERDEFDAAQGRENGDGLAIDLERTAAENNATEAAVDAGFDTTLPATVKEPNVVPLILAAVAAYFFL